MPILLVTINPGLQIVGTLAIGFEFTGYSSTVQAFGGLEPYQMTVTSSLPAGLIATDNGDGTLTISGVPVATTVTTVDVQVTDARSRRVRKSLQLTILSTFRITEDGENRITEDEELRIPG